MYKLRIIPVDIEKYSIREVLHADRHIAMQAASDYADFCDVQEVEIIDNDTGEIIDVISDKEPDLTPDDGGAVSNERNWNV